MVSRAMAGSAAPGVEVSSDRQNLAAGDGPFHRAIARRRKEERNNDVRIQGRGPQLHVTQFRRRTSKHLLSPTRENSRFTASGTDALCPLRDLLRRY